MHLEETVRTNAAALLHVVIAETEGTKEAVQTEDVSTVRCLCFSLLPYLPSRKSRSVHGAALLLLAALLATKRFRPQAPSLVEAGEHVLVEAEYFLKRLRAWILSSACESWDL